MRNLRKRYSLEQVEEMRSVVQSLRAYLVPLLMKRQDGASARCRKSATKYDIHHTIYNPMVTIEHLQLLCEPCHVAVTGYVRYSKQ